MVGTFATPTAVGCDGDDDDDDDDDGMVGHRDIPNNPMFSPSWSSVHMSQGCTENNLNGTGGAGRLYCFAI